jgi:hypothetical protein
MNNIFYFEGKGRWGKHPRGINTEFRNNLYFNIMPHESDSSANTTDPRFINPGRAATDIDLKTMEALRGYQLNPDSPCINSGIDIPNDGARDILKREVKAVGTNIGAF